MNWNNVQIVPTFVDQGVSCYQLEDGDFKNEYYIVSEAETRKLLNNPEIVGYETYYCLIPSTSQMLYYFKEQKKVTTANILSILRGALNYPLEESCYREHIRVHDISFLSSERVFNEDEIAGLKQTVEDAQTATSSADQKNQSYEELLNAYVAYASDDHVKAGETLANVNRDLLSENAQQIYDNMLTDVQSAMMEADMNEAMNLYEQKDYSGAITKLESIVQSDEGYQEGKAAYYLAFAYNYQNDESNALKWFQIARDKTNSSSVRNTCKEMIGDMQSRGITVPGESQTTDNQSDTSDGDTSGDNSDNND